MKEAANGSPTVFLEDMDGIGLLILFRLRQGATIENAHAVEYFLDMEGRPMTVQSDDDFPV